MTARRDMGVFLVVGTLCLVEREAKRKAHLLLGSNYTFMLVGSTLDG